jgi:GAF domain-containing protein
VTRLVESTETCEEQERAHRSELERREQSFELIVQVGQIAAAATEPRALLQQVARQFVTLCPRYQVGLYLLSGDSDWAVLGARAGGQSAELSPCRPRVAVGDGTTVGRCLAQGQLLVWPAEDKRNGHFERVFQTGARSELAVPIQNQEHLLGAMSIYSDRLEPFEERFISAVTTTGRQLGCALQRMRLAQAMQNGTRSVSETPFEREWHGLFQSQNIRGYRYAHGQVEPAYGEWSPEMREAFDADRAVTADGEGSTDGRSQCATVAMPIRMRKHVVGALRFRKTADAVGWTKRELHVLELIVEELGEALVAAQLYDDAQHHAARQQLVGDLSSRMRQTLDVEAVLRAAAAELREALGLSEVVVRLQSPAVIGGDASMVPAEGRGVTSSDDDEGRDG